jgi:hypothetical protein
MPRPRRRQPDPARFPPCARCGQCYPGGTGRWPEGRVCKYCYLQARLRTGTCSGCGALTSLPGLNTAGQPACTRCSGIPARFRCGCGREVTAGEHGRCWWCVLTELVTDALAGPGGQVPSHLRPLADGLVSMHRPHSGVAWLRRSAIARETLQELARDRMPCSHAALDALRTGRAVVPALAAGPVRRAAAPRPAPGRLPALGRRQARCHRRCRAPPAARTIPPLAPAAPPAIRRHHATPLGHGPYQRAKQRLTVATAFLAWPAGRGRQLGDCTQHDLDAWFGTGPTTRRHVITFLSWARQQRIIRELEVPVISTAGTEACPPGPDARLAAIRRLLLDQTLTPGDRIAGCLVTLYGQQASTIAVLRTTDTSCAAGVTRLKLGADWLDVPEPVATVLRQHLRNRTNMTRAANPASPWLFPGQLAGEHRSYRRLVRVLHQPGIPVRASRLAAWRELARQAPPAVLADALGVSAGTAMRHAFLGSADWSAYAARRHAHTPDEQTSQQAITVVANVVPGSLRVAGRCLQ